MFEAHAGKFVAIFLLVLFAAAITEDLRVPLWTDELLTLYVTSQPTIPDVLGAIREGVDSQPPLYDLLVRSLRPIIPNDALRVRLPSTVGFILMCMCVFLFVQRHLPAIYAVLAMLAAALTTWTYAFEGRSYGMVLGCVGVALVSWQAAAETGQRRALVALSLSLAAAIAFHYFAVLVLCALFAGESVRWWKSRKLDLPMLAALLFPPLVLIPHLSLIRAGRPFVKYFWSKALFESLYSFYFPVVRSLWVAFCVAALCLLWLAARGAKSKNEKQRQTNSALPAHEWMVAFTLMLLPELVIVALYFTIQVFVDRYLLWSMIGVAIFLTMVLYRLAGGSRTVAAIVTVPLLIASAVTIVHAATERPFLRHAASLQRELLRIPSGPTPIVIANVHAFMELSFYSEPDLRRRLVYLISPELSRYYNHTDTSALLMSALRRREPLGIADYDTFIAANPSFIVAGESGDWIVQHLRRLNYHFVPLDEGTDPELFEVQAPGSAGSAR